MKFHVLSYGILCTKFPILRQRIPKVGSLVDIVDDEVEVHLRPDIFRIDFLLPQIWPTVASSIAHRQA
jgi:hypothetical protein